MLHLGELYWRVEITTRQSALEGLASSSSSPSVRPSFLNGCFRFPSSLPPVVLRDRPSVDSSSPYEQPIVLALGKYCKLSGVAMAPIKDETVDSLRDLVHKLESRIQQLEAKLEGSGGASAQQAKTDGPSVRMILMGPPGAGTKNTASNCVLYSADPGP